MLDLAREFAVSSHGPQTYGDRPYVYHLDAVVALLEPYGEEAQVIGFLHDVVEDTEVSFRQIEQLFSNRIAAAVEILTDQPGDTREERKNKTYALMADVSGELEVALVVKTADRLANVMACVEQGRDDKLVMYQKEQDQFYSAAYRPNLCDDLWSRLNELLS